MDLVETVSHGPYLELFARNRRPDWDAWGNEVEGDVALTKGLGGPGRGQKDRGR